MMPPAIPAIHFEFPDDAELHQAFLRLNNAVSGPALESCVVAGALPVMNEAKRLAPLVTGTLRRSIHIGGHSDLNGDFAGGTQYSDIGGNENTPFTASVWVGTNLVYARRVEYGFVGRDRLGRYYNQGPRGYLRGAVDTQQEAAQADFERALAFLLRDV